MASSVQVLQIRRPSHGIPVALDTVEENEKTLTATGTAQAGTGWTFDQQDGNCTASDYFVRVTVAGDTSIRILFGTAPVVTQSTGFLCTPGVHFLPVKLFGYTFSVINLVAA